jgi:hypothetical protein
MMKFATLLTITTTAYGLAFDGPLPTPVQDLLNVALDGWTPRPTNEARSLPDLFRRQKVNSAVCGYLDGDAGKTFPFFQPLCSKEKFSDPNHQGHPLFSFGNTDDKTFIISQPFMLLSQSLTEAFKKCQNAAMLISQLDYPVSCPTGSCIYNTASKWFGCCTSSSCPIVTRCVNSASVSSCLDDASCYNDPLAMACTASSAPYCVNMFAKIAEGTMSHWVCGASATSVGVSASATSASAGQTSVAKLAQSSKGGAAVSTVASGINAATPVADSVKSTGGAALPTAHVMLGAAGGLVGVFALFL